MNELVNKLITERDELQEKQVVINQLKVVRINHDN